MGCSQTEIKARLILPSINPSRSQYSPGTHIQSQSFNKVEDQLRTCIPCKRQTPRPAHTTQHKLDPDLLGRCGWCIKRFRKYVYWFSSLGLVEQARWLRFFFKTCMLYWCSCLDLVEHARWLRLACYTGFCIGFVTGVCNPVGFRVVCFVQGTEIPLVHVQWFQIVAGFWFEAHVWGLDARVCIPTGFSVVCFVPGSGIPLVHVVSDFSWFLGWSPCLGFDCKCKGM